MDAETVKVKIRDVDVNIQQTLIKKCVAITIFYKKIKKIKIRNYISYKNSPNSFIFKG